MMFHRSPLTDFSTILLLDQLAYFNILNIYPRGNESSRTGDGGGVGDGQLLEFPAKFIRAHREMNAHIRGFKRSIVLSGAKT